VQTILAAGEAHKLPMRGRLWSSLSLLLAAAVGATTVTASFKQPQPQTGGIFVKRTLLSAMLASAGLSAATITGSIYDPSGATVPDAKLLLLNPDTGQKLETASGPDGKFGLADAPAGDYILRVEKPGFEPLLREFSLKENSVVERGLTLNAANASGNTPAAANSGRIRVRGQVAQDNLIHKVTPVYPAGAKQARLQGTVELNAVVSKEGVPVELQVIRSPGEELSQSALEAVRQWRYRPVLLNGNPVEIVTDVIVNYTLSQ
jgi:TonB family protein